MQNVATISSTQITPVEVPVEVPVKVPVVVPVEVPVEVPVVVPVTTCGATGDVAKSSAVINASFFICALVLRYGPSPTRRCVLAATRACASRRWPTRTGGAPSTCSTALPSNRFLLARVRAALLLRPTAAKSLRR